MKKKIVKNSIVVALGLAICSSWYTPVSWAAVQHGEDIDVMIQSQQQILQQLNEKKNQKATQEVLDKIKEIEAAIQALKEQPQSKSYDAQGAIEALSAQLNELRAHVESQNTMQDKILEVLKRLEEKEDKQKSDAGIEENYHGLAATRNYLVNPGPAQNVSYTQDAVNAQGNSTMVFSYSPNQMYKIYCRRGYLTDLSFKKGETLNFVGGGDTAGWSIANTVVDGVAHLYIKPVVEASTTNLVVTTDKRSYQIILNASNWYNPMVTWTYGAEEREANLLEKKKDDRLVTGRLNVSNYDDLDFDYEVSGDGEKPVMVFSDGNNTYIKFKRSNPKMVPLFVKEKGKKGMTLMNYKVKDNYFIVEKVFDTALFKISENSSMTIRHKK